MHCQVGLEVRPYFSLSRDLLEDEHDEDDLSGKFSMLKPE